MQGNEVQNSAVPCAAVPCRAVRCRAARTCNEEGQSCSPCSQSCASILCEATEGATVLSGSHAKVAACHRDGDAAVEQIRGPSPRHRCAASSCTGLAWGGGLALGACPSVVAAAQIRPERGITAALSPRNGPCHCVVRDAISPPLTESAPEVRGARSGRCGSGVISVDSVVGHVSDRLLVPPHCIRPAHGGVGVEWQQTVVAASNLAHPQCLNYQEATGCCEPGAFLCMCVPMRVCSSASA